MKKKLAATIIFVVILVFPMVFWPLLNYVDRAEIDENRTLAPYPDTFNNEYFSKFDKYFLDHLPLCNSLIKIYSEAQKTINKAYDKLLLAFNLEHYIEQNNVVFGENNWLFYSNDNSLDYYRGINLPTESEMQSYVDRAKIVSDYFKSQGKDFVIMIMPNKEQIYTEYMPTGIKVHSQTKKLDMVNDYFAEKSDVKFLYPKQALLDAKRNYQVYYKQDTQWSRAGGYFGTLELLDMLGIARAEAALTQVETSSRADLAKMLLQTPIKDVDYDCVYRAEIKHSVTLSDEVFTAVTDNPNGRKMVLLGDSFRENMIDVLCKEFSQSVLAHRSRFNVSYNYFNEEISAADVVIFQAVERYEGQIFGEGGLLDKFINLYNLR